MENNVNLDYKSEEEIIAAKEMSSTPRYYSSNSKMVDFIINHSGGKIQDEKQANYFMIAVTAIMIVIFIFLNTNIGKKKGPIPDQTNINKIMNEIKSKSN